MHILDSFPAKTWVTLNHSIAVLESWHGTPRCQAHSQALLGHWFWMIVSYCDAVLVCPSRAIQGPQNLQIGRSIIFFRPGLSGYQRTLCWLHCCDRHGYSGHCALRRSSARGLRPQPFLEDTQESSTAFCIVEFPRLWSCVRPTSTLDGRGRDGR